MLTNACKTPITIFQSISNKKKSMVRSMYIHRSFLEALRLFKKSYFQDLMQKQVYFRPSFDEKVIISGRSVLLSPFNFLENLMAPFYGQGLPSSNYKVTASRQVISNQQVQRKLRKSKNEILNKWLSLMIIAIFSSLFPSDIGENYAESSST